MMESSSNDYASIYTSERKLLDLNNVINKGVKKLTQSTSGYGQDWLLVLDDAAKNYAKP
ncbi:MAG: hypothetical protein ABI325_07080 [Ginsengibacter sp.]